MQESTGTATASQAIKGGIDFAGILWGAIRGFGVKIVDKIPYHDWPYWLQVAEILGGLIAISFLYWLWKNWIR